MRCSGCKKSRNRHAIFNIYGEPVKSTLCTDCYLESKKKPGAKPEIVPMKLLIGNLI